MKRGQLRIIAGKWRGRKINVPDQVVRPTPDRVRETLFNWLSSVIVGARCLDLFAGSGALGLEALSRGAREVLLMDCSPLAVLALQQTLSKLQAQNGTIRLGSFPGAFLEGELCFDVVFLDPPYHSNLLPTCFVYLEEKKLLAKTAFIYVESPQPVVAANLPLNWKIIKQKKTGQVCYQLILRENLSLPQT